MNTGSTLDQVDGDLSDGDEKYWEAATNSVLDSPHGPIRLDQNHWGFMFSFDTDGAKQETVILELSSSKRSADARHRCALLPSSARLRARIPSARRVLI